MMLKEKRDIKPLLIKFGVALAISFAGFLYSRLRTRRSRPSLPHPSPRCSDHGSEVDRVHKDDLNALKTTSVSAERHDEKVILDSPVVDISPSSRHSGGKEGFLLPEFNDLVKDFDFAAANVGFSPKKDVETPTSDIDTPKTFRSSEKDNYEQEIRQLKSMVRMLRERERSLEVQLLEYYGLKEQETAVMELQNRLKINTVEAKLFALKIESLQADNRRLEAQLADQAKVLAELEAARAKIKFLKRKLRTEAEHNKDQILALQRRVTKLQELENTAAPSDPEIQFRLQRLKDLEGEVEGLRKSNLGLRLENSDLARRLESTQILANSVLEDKETEELKEEGNRLRQENEDLEKKIERLQADRCADVEELVYLRWINACLRFELRNYQPPPGKTVARDLSKSLSPKSEEKAKQLILEYANTEGVGEKGINIMDFDSDQWSSSHASYITDSGGDYEDFSVDNSSATKTNSSSKYKFFSKLRRLVHGKESHHRSSSVDRTVSFEDSDSPQSISMGNDMVGELQSNRFATPTHSSFRHSLDIQRLRSLKEDESKDGESSQRNSDVGSYGYKRFVLSRESSCDLGVENQRDNDSDSGRKSELVKFAEALKVSRGGVAKVHRKSASYSFS